MNSGIYAIFNKKSGKAYIGQTNNLKRRKNDHIRELRKGTHHNKYLQRAYNKDGENAFSFIILEKCPLEDLNCKEKKWIEQLETMDSHIGYNLESGGNKNKVVSEKTREAKRGKNNPMFGKKLSKEHIESLRIKNRGLNSTLTEKDVKNIKEQLVNGTAAAKLSEKYNVSLGVISKIKSCKNWVYVRKDLNSELINMHKKEKKERDKEIIRLDSLGYSRKRISDEVGCTRATVARVLKEPSRYFKSSNEKSEFIKKIVDDFNSGMSKQEIMDKYKISNSSYITYTHDAYNIKINSIKNKAVEMRKSGIMVKDIAKELGFARTTISRWTKEVM